MIVYKANRCGFAPLCKKFGSIIPRAALMAIFPATAAFALRLSLDMQDATLMEDGSKKETLQRLYNTFFWFLGFVLVFRTTIAYNRYWDGVVSLNIMSTEWHDACSQICVFSAASKKPSTEIRAFTGCVIRLFSLLNCLAMQEVADMEDEDFEILDTQGFDRELLKALNELEEPGHRKDLVHHWIQRVVIEGMGAGLIKVEAAIVSRAFQELNSGMIAVARMKAIAGTVFPFPYAQMISWCILLLAILTPLFVCSMDLWPLSAFCVAFASVVCPNMLNLIASEIEMPFGDDANDLNCFAVQQEFNNSLVNLLKPLAFSCPAFGMHETPKLDAKRSSLVKLSALLKVGGSGQNAFNALASTEKSKFGSESSESPSFVDVNKTSSRVEKKALELKNAEESASERGKSISKLDQKETSKWSKVRPQQQQQGPQLQLQPEEPISKLDNNKEKSKWSKLLPQQLQPEEPQQSDEQWQRNQTDVELPLEFQPIEDSGTPKTSASHVEHAEFMLADSKIEFLQQQVQAQQRPQVQQQLHFHQRQRQWQREEQQQQQQHFWRQQQQRLHEEQQDWQRQHPQRMPSSIPYVTHAAPYPYRYHPEQHSEVYRDTYGYPSRACAHQEPFQRTHQKRLHSEGRPWSAPKSRDTGPSKTRTRTERTNAPVIVENFFNMSQVAPMCPECNLLV